MIRYFLHALGCLLCLFLTFRIGAQVHFPTQELKERISYEVQEGSDGKWLLNSDDLVLNGLTALTLKNVVLSKRSKPKKEHEIFTEFEELSLSAELQDIISGQYGANIETKLLQGDTSLDFLIPKEGEIHIDLKSTGMNLSVAPTEGKDWFMHLLGTAELKSNIKHNRKKVKKSSGDINLIMNDLVIENAKVMGIELSSDLPKLVPMSFSESTLVFELEKGKAKVTQGSFTSDMIQIEVGGYIKLNKKLSKSRLHLTLDMTMEDDLASAMKFHPKTKKALHDDGTFKFKVEGFLNKPKMVPNQKRKKGRSTKPKSGRKKRPPKRNKAIESEPDDEGDGEETAGEKRRRERRERLEKRREERRARREKRAGMEMVRPDLVTNSAITRDINRSNDNDGGQENEPTNEDIQEADDGDGQPQFDEDDE